VIIDWWTLERGLKACRNRVFPAQCQWAFRLFYWRRSAGVVRVITGRDLLVLAGAGALVLGAFISAGVFVWGMGAFDPRASAFTVTMLNMPVAYCRGTCSRSLLP